MRTKKTILNMISDTVPFIIMAVLGFMKIRAYNYYLGQEFYGLNQLFLQVFSYLNLAEAGFGAAIVYALYKPVSDDNKEKINRILSGARIIFKRIGIVILMVGFILSFFMDYLIKDNPTSTLYTQILFIIYLITSTGNYFVFAPRFMLQADQNKYLINWANNIIRILQIVTEIILLILGFDLMVIFISYFIYMIIANVIINKITYKNYPWISVYEKPDFSTYGNTKHVFMHRIGSSIALGTDNIILAAFMGLQMVAVYSTYNYVIQFIISITGKIINSAQESFGNFFINKDKTEGINTYWEMNAFLFFMGGILFTVTSISINDFIYLWMGSELLVSNITALLFCIIFYYRIVRGSSIVIVNGIGAFKETKWQALFEGLINLCLSILLINKYGMNGILAATIISYLVTGFWFVPNYIFNNVFNQSVSKYYLNYALNVIILVVINILSHKVFTIIGFYKDNENLLQWIFDSIWVTIIVALVYFCIYFVFFKHFRMFISRFTNVYKKRKRNE